MSSKMNSTTRDGDRCLYGEMLHAESVRDSWDRTLRGIINESNVTFGGVKLRLGSTGVFPEGIVVSVRMADGGTCVDMSVPDVAAMVKWLMDNVVTEWQRRRDMGVALEADDGQVRKDPEPAVEAGPVFGSGWTNYCDMQGGLLWVEDGSKLRGSVGDTVIQGGVTYQVRRVFRWGRQQIVNMERIT